MPNVLYINADSTLSLTGLSAGGSYLNSATVTYAIYTAAGEAVSGGTGSYSYTAASNGDYTATVESTVTADLTDGAMYTVRVTISSGAYNDHRRIPHRACYRTDT